MHQTRDERSGVLNALLKIVAIEIVPINENRTWI